MFWVLQRSSMCRDRDGRIEEIKKNQIVVIWESEV